MTNQEQFESRANEIASAQPQDLLGLWGFLGVEGYVEDHVVCFMCQDRTDAHCPGVEAAQSILALAEEFNIPKESL
jgi:hypothetical protein